MNRHLRRGVVGGAFLGLITFLYTRTLCLALHDAAAADDYMNRFNIPANHIHLEWAKSGSGLRSTSYKGKTYTWLPRSQVAGVKAGYATMWDRSSKGYCTRSDAQTDTQRFFGQRLMAVGACPNYGKYIAFVDRSGNPVDDQERFTNEIHGNTMPFTTNGCSSSASPGNSEVPMAQSGWGMYSGYLVKCPFSQAVYQNDMLNDSEYDPNVCSFVTLNNPLLFLDTSQKEGSLAYRPYAFHGKGGHKGYDFVGSGVGCPPYSPPQTTRSMKSPDIANDPFLCSQLSRCTNLCWPWDTNRPCYRSLPVSFNHATSECLILGYHTQTYWNSSCAVKTTTDTNAKYCVKAHKTVASSKFTYLTAFTRPDFETACRKPTSLVPTSLALLRADPMGMGSAYFRRGCKGSASTLLGKAWVKKAGRHFPGFQVLYAALCHFSAPREPLKNVVFGTSSLGVCIPLAASSKSTGDAGQCGEAVFNVSSDDTPSGAGGNGLSSIYWSSWIPDSSGSSQGTCNLYSTVPNCIFTMTGAISFTALSAADPSLAVSPPPAVITPGPCSSNPCKNGGTCVLPDGTCKCPACYSGATCETEAAGCCVSNADCSGHGSCSGNKCTCDAGYSGATCETGACGGVDCKNGGTCKMPNGTCECPTGYSGSQCETGACDGVVCKNGGTCKMPNGTCECPTGYSGSQCETGACDGVDCKNGGTCKLPNGKCQCPQGYSGGRCEITACDNVVCQNGGTCIMPGGTCKCPDCFSGGRCDVQNFRCCKNDSDCHAPLGTCVNNSCQCKPSITGDKCENGGCSTVTCANGGSCDEATGNCKCPPCYSGANCEKRESNCCANDTDCNAPNGVCSSSNQCQCTPEFSAPNCEDLCTKVSCSNGAKCNPATGDCICPVGWGGASCTEPEPCGTGGDTCSGNTVCDAQTFTCVCKPGYMGEDCTEVAPECEETCKIGGHIIREDANQCKVDCYSTCCNHAVNSCKSETSEALQQCITDKLKEREEEACCVARHEEGSNVALYATAGILALLLLAGAAGGTYYATQSGGAGSGASPEAPPDETVGGKHRPTRAESAISVDFEDYANTPDDDGTGALNTGGEPAQEAVWDEDA